MQKSRNKVTQSENRGLKIAFRIFCVIACLWIAGCIASEATIRKAEQGPNVMQLREYLQGGYSFFVEPEGWAEEIAMTRVINKYNQEQKYGEEDMYKTFHMVNNAYWVTSERISYAEFAITAGDFYMCLGDMLSGIRQEKGTFYFYYVNKAQESKLSFILGTAMLSESDLNIEVTAREGEEITIVCITVEPKTSAKGGI